MKTVRKFDFDELIESHLNGNISHVNECFKKMSYIDKDNFIDHIDADEILTTEQKFSLLRHLLRSTF